jgi:hypothetical protein
MLGSALLFLASKKEGLMQSSNGVDARRDPIILDRKWDYALSKK